MTSEIPLKRSWIRKLTFGEALLATFTLLLVIPTFMLWFATRDLVNDARATAQKQLRAYIAVEPTGLTLAAGAPVDMLYKAKNSGLTPAYHVRFYSGVVILPFPLPRGFQLPGTSDDTAMSVTTLAAGGESAGYKSSNEAISNDEYQLVLNGSMFGLYLVGIVRYVDAFGLEHKTEYCSYTGGPRLAAAMARVTASPDQKVTDVTGLWWSCNEHNDAN
jgi:hypothetical protein